MLPSLAHFSISIMIKTNAADRFSSSLHPSMHIDQASDFLAAAASDFVMIVSSTEFSIDQFRVFILVL